MIYDPELRASQVDMVIWRISFGHLRDMAFLVGKSLWMRNRLDSDAGTVVTKATRPEVRSRGIITFHQTVLNCTYVHEAQGMLYRYWCGRYSWADIAVIATRTQASFVL